MTRQKELETLMKSAGFSLARHKRHAIWKHPSGAMVSTSMSPSDKNAVKRAAQQLTKVCLEWGLPLPRMGDSNHGGNS